MKTLITVCCMAFSAVTPAESDTRPKPSTVLDEGDLLFSEIPSISSASRYEQPETKAPASVSIVTADQIKKYGYRTLAAILGSLPGFLTTYDRAYNHIGVRGFAPPGDYNMRLLVLVDGHRINDNLEDYSAIGRDFILDVDNIERVEVVRGPASSLYGSSAFFGVVSVITKRGRDLQGTQVAGEVSSFGTHEEQGAVGRRFDNGLEGYLSASHYESQGHSRLAFSDLSGNRQGVARDLDGDRAERLFGKGSYGDLTLSGGYVTRKKFLPTGTTTTIFNDPRVFYRDTRAYADLNYRHTFAEAWDVTGRLFWDYYGFDDALPYAIPGGSVVNQDQWSGQWFGGEFLVSRTLFERNHLTLGAEYRRNYQQRMVNADLAPYALNANNRLNSTIFGVFAQDEIRILDNLHLNAGLRYDHYETFGGTLNPRVGLIYDPVPGTTLKWLYGPAFRAPSSFESLYTCCNNTWLPNSNLKPETIETFEFVWEQAIGEHLRLHLSPFYYRLKDIISLNAYTVRDPVTGTDSSYKQYTNNPGTMGAAGVEAQLIGHWEQVEGRLSYSFQDARSGGKGLPNSPNHMVKFNLSAPIWGDKTFAGLEVQYTSS
ncbi:MAG: TonB-dependent receptor, partial [Methylococcaceae bacterium]|nr:TonB-dependent receptor [Methylococcaceae bacterium]